MGIVVAFAAAALRTYGPVPAEQGAVSIAAALPAAVGVDDKVRGRRLGKKGPLQGLGDQFFRHGGPYVPTHDVFGSRVLEGTQIGPTGYGPVAVGQRRYVMSDTQT